LLQIGELVDGWESDQELKHLFVSKDIELVKKLSVIINKSKKRENELNNVTDKLNAEVEELAKYLNKMIGNLEATDLFDPKKTNVEAEKWLKLAVSREKTLIENKI
jgi:hypothetical protein